MMFSLLPREINKEVISSFLDPASHLCFRIVLDEYIVQKGDFSKEVVYSIVSNGLNLVKYFFYSIRETSYHHSLPELAIKYDNNDILEFLIDNHYSIPEDASTIAARYGAINILATLPVDQDCIVPIAIKNGHINILEWAKKRNYKYTDYAYILALRHNQMHILVWLKEHSCPLTELVFECAAVKGNIKILKWLKENNCPWGPETPAYAASNNKFKALTWLIYNGCPWDSRTWEWAEKYEYNDIVQWCRDLVVTLSNGTQ